MTRLTGPFPPETDDPIPSEAQCRALLAASTLPRDRVAHCDKVAEVAMVLAVRLKARGHDLDLDLVLAGALLHDIAKGVRNHSLVGAARLRDMGFRRVAVIAGAHMDIRLDEHGHLDEAVLVYMADKMVRGSELVGTWGRFKPRFDALAAKPDILAMMQGRLANARIIQQRIEDALGEPLSAVLSFHDPAPEPQAR
jgi:hypothetical protein